MTYSVFRIITVAVLPLLMAACGNSPEKKTANADSVKAGMAEHHHDSLDQSVATSVVIKDASLNALYGQYQELTKALINGDERGATVAANALAAGAQQLKETAVAKVASEITTAPGLEAKRTLFAGLSSDMIAKVKKAGVQQGTLYVDFCPMALSDKGAHWLSAEKEVKNPYFGEEMMNCGNIEDSIH
ncbi:DUF3347 domain-containing protein [Filimonas effusa]|uniref:DUF3347 domain-containing protein n=1 Tax=Filimonas effusa TaxID=2508721 RepID=A0A4Q1DAY2_9BACT|nr:DUF3347 domain-containing protein [Filimonas effusa]RXK85649.1 DUF3347 domain-containing protein [Filimonas effusa]